MMLKFGLSAREMDEMDSHDLTGWYQIIKMYEDEKERQIEANKHGR
jgi:hypothetical protein